MTNNTDIIIVGAGLSGLITAWRCLDVNPDLTVTIYEASNKIAGDHTWSFNLSDIPEFLHDWIKPFIAYQWPCYDVKFPDYTRTLEIPYCTGNSESLRACVQPYIDEGRLEIILNTDVQGIRPDCVVLEDGIRAADCVLDARGFEPNESVFLGYQKFVGHTIKTKEPHGLKHPIIMDATVEQLGGYRFVYCLPFSEDEVLVEDTYYTDGAELKEETIDARIASYIESRLNLSEYLLIRQEKGVLPITLALDGPNYSPVENRVGIRGGFFHAVTGYSTPNAVLLSDLIATIMEGELHPENIDTEMTFATNRHFLNEKFFRLLNRMLFRAAKPDQRYKVLQRFYKLDEDLIKRFYAGTLTKADKIRILSGKPPVPIHLALYNFSEKAFIRRERQKRKRDS